MNQILGELFLVKRKPDQKLLTHMNANAPGLIKGSFGKAFALKLERQLAEDDIKLVNSVEARNYLQMVGSMKKNNRVEHKDVNVLTRNIFKYREKFSKMITG